MNERAIAHRRWSSDDVKHFVRPVYFGITSSHVLMGVAAATAHIMRVPTYTRATIDNLMSTGNLRFIQSESIKGRIAAYDQWAFDAIPLDSLFIE